MSDDAERRFSVRNSSGTESVTYRSFKDGVETCWNTNKTNSFSVHTKPPLENVRELAVAAVPRRALR
jgi:hypothetical protein